MNIYEYTIGLDIISGQNKVTKKKMNIIGKRLKGITIIYFLCGHGINLYSVFDKENCILAKVKCQKADLVESHKIKFSLL